MFSYFDVDYNDAYEFLSEQSVDIIEPLFDKYDIIAEEQSWDYSIDQLAELISDEDLVALGYNKNSDDKKIMENFLAPYDDVVKFLENDVCDDDLEELYYQYNTHDIESIASGITDDELAKLGYFDDEEEDEVYENEEFIDSWYSDYPSYNEEVDFLEDMPTDFEISVLYADPDEVVLSVPSEEEYEIFKELVDPTLVESCEVIELEDVDNIEGYPFRVKPVDFTKIQVNEDVIVNKELNPVIFNDDHTMIEDVREKILDYTNNFITYLDNKGINELDSAKIDLIGSNAGYLYTPESDIDVHFVIDNPLDTDVFDLLLDEFNFYVTEHPITIGDYQIELNVEDGFNNTANSARRYSVTDNTWIDDSDKNEVYSESDVNLVAGYEDEVKKYTDLINEYVDNDEYKLAVALKEEIRGNRSKDLREEGALSMGNVVFKELRNAGMYDKLRQYIHSKGDVE